MRTKRTNRLLCGLLVVLVPGCAHDQDAPKNQPPARVVAAKPRPSAAAPSCRAAVAQEADLLAAAIRADAPGSELAAGLEAFAKSPVVTRESVARLAGVRYTVRAIGPDSQNTTLAQAARAVDQACRIIDSPEQQAVDAVDLAIQMLDAKDYRAVLERFTEPATLAAMKRDQRFDPAVARFENGWGPVLLNKLKKARQAVPAVNPDQTISFSIAGVQGPMTHPLTLVKRGDRWYFRD